MLCRTQISCDDMFVSKASEVINGFDGLTTFCIKLTLAYVHCAVMCVRESTQLNIHMELIPSALYFLVVAFCQLGLLSISKTVCHAMRYCSGMLYPIKYITSKLV